jgi:hypothetical protein
LQVVVFNGGHELRNGVDDPAEAVEEAFLVVLDFHEFAEYVALPIHGVVGETYVEYDVLLDVVLEHGIAISVKRREIYVGEFFECVRVRAEFGVLMLDLVRNVHVIVY